jgi:hypothetical protein
LNCNASSLELLPTSVTGARVAYSLGVAMVSGGAWTRGGVHVLVRHVTVLELSCTSCVPFLFPSLAAGKKATEHTVSCLRLSFRCTVIFHLTRCSTWRSPFEVLIREGATRVLRLKPGTVDLGGIVTGLEVVQGVASDWVLYLNIQTFNPDEILDILVHARVHVRHLPGCVGRVRKG